MLIVLFISCKITVWFIVFYFLQKWSKSRLLYRLLVLQQYPIRDSRTAVSMHRLLSSRSRHRTRMYSPRHGLRIQETDSNHSPSIRNACCTIGYEHLNLLSFKMSGAEQGGAFDTITVHNFHEKISEQTIHFHVMKMSGGFFLWVGSSPTLSNLAVSMISKFVSLSFKLMWRPFIVLHKVKPVRQANQESSILFHINS